MRGLTYTPSTLRWLTCKALGTVSPKVFWSRLSSLRFSAIPTPALPCNTWVRLQTVLGGICGSDMSLVSQRSHPSSFMQGLMSFPVVLGHENVAIIEEVGSAVQGWRVGDRVCVEPSLSCATRGIEPACRNCRAGCFSLCERTAATARYPEGMMIGLNAFTGGTWAPYFVAHQSQLHRVPEQMPDEEAVLTDPMACALHGVLRHRPRDGDRVFVLGSGIVGIGVVASMRALGCAAEITVGCRHEYQAELCRRFGADDIIIFPRGQSARQRLDVIASHFGGRCVDGRFGACGFIGGFDVVYDCVGTSDSISEAMKVTRARGTTVLIGNSHINLIDTTSLWSQELHVVGVSGRQIERVDGREQHTYPLLYDLIARKKISLEGLLTHTFTPEHYKRAFGALTSRHREPVVKAAFTHC